MPTAMENAVASYIAADKAALNGTKVAVDEFVETLTGIVETLAPFSAIPSYRTSNLISALIANVTMGMTEINSLISAYNPPSQPPVVNPLP